MVSGGACSYDYNPSNLKKVTPCKMSKEGIRKMDFIETVRIRLVCNTYEEMCISRDMGDELAMDFVGAYDYHKELIKKGEFKEKDLLWYRLWSIVNKDDDKNIGGICFKGPANEKGQVEVGYGIDEKYQNQGYGTEAISKITEWALGQEGIDDVIAETEKENIASQKLLKKVGYKLCNETEENYYWRYRD